MRSALSHRNSGHRLARKLYPLRACERCGEPGRDRHHKDGDTHNNVPENVEILCRPCHQKTDGRVEILRANGARAAAAQAARTHCPQGHPYDDENTYVNAKGKRSCRACRRIPGGRGPYRRK